MHGRQLAELSRRVDFTNALAAELNDEKINISNENRIVVHGLSKLTTQSRPEQQAEAQKRLTGLFTQLFGACPAIVRASYFDSDKPVYEATLSSSSEASKLRREFGKMPFADRRKSGVRLVNSVTPATRVRLSILKSYGSAFKKQHPQGVFSIMSFLSRPLVRCRAESSGPIRTLGFVDVINNFPPSTVGLNDSDFGQVSGHMLCVIVMCVHIYFTWAVLTLFASYFIQHPLFGLSTSVLWTFLSEIDIF